MSEQPKSCSEFNPCTSYYQKTAAPPPKKNPPQNGPPPPALPFSPAGWRKSSCIILPSDSSFSALRGLVGDPVEDFLPLSPEIIAIEDSLPMALTALPVFWKRDTGLDSSSVPGSRWAVGLREKSPAQEKQLSVERGPPKYRGSAREVSPTLLCSALSVCQKMFGEWNGAWNRCVR